MKRLKPVLNDQATLITHNGILRMIPTPSFHPSESCRHGSHCALTSQIFFANTAIRFPFPRSFPTALTCPLALQTFVIFPSAIFPCATSRAFTTMTISIPPTLPSLLQDTHPTTPVPLLTNDTHDHPPQAWTPIPFLAEVYPTLQLQPPLSTPIALSPNASLIPHPPTPPRTTTAIGHDPKRRCVPGDDHAEK
jgi:hypothetical protein